MLARPPTVSPVPSSPNRLSSSPVQSSPPPSYSSVRLAVYSPPSQSSDGPDGSKLAVVVGMQPTSATYFATHPTFIHFWYLVMATLWASLWNSWLPYPVFVYFLGASWLLLSSGSSSVLHQVVPPSIHSSVNSTVWAYKLLSSSPSSVSSSFPSSWPPPTSPELFHYTCVSPYRVHSPSVLAVFSTCIWTLPIEDTCRTHRSSCHSNYGSIWIYIWPGYQTVGAANRVIWGT